MKYRYFLYSIIAICLLYSLKDILQTEESNKDHISYTFIGEYPKEYEIKLFVKKNGYYVNDSLVSVKDIENLVMQKIKANDFAVILFVCDEEITFSKVGELCRNFYKNDKVAFCLEK